MDETLLFQLLDDFLTLNRAKGDTAQTVGIKATIDYIHIAHDLKWCVKPEAKEV